MFTLALWQHNHKILSFPHGWQQPAKTEQWAYECCTENPADNRFVQIVCFPWATLIDLQRKGQTTAARQYEDILHTSPPKTTLIRATVCQHIYARDMLPWFKQLKITDLFWPHATTSELELDGIRIHPFPLYPVCTPDEDASPIPLIKRKYLYSFVGAYDPGLYLSDVRHQIFNLPKRGDAIVSKRSEWHFEPNVYQAQVAGVPLTEEQQNVQATHEREYRAVLEQSLFSLCPSGSGPNSIRLWESLEYGCIPVILSDTLRLPGDEAVWRQAALFVPETPEAIAALPERLELLRNDSAALAGFQAAGKELRAIFGKQANLCQYMMDICEDGLAGGTPTFELK